MQDASVFALVGGSIMGHAGCSVLVRLSVLLWLAVIVTDILRATVDGFEDATTTGLPASLAAAALVATACTVIRALARAAQPRHRTLGAVAVVLWMMEAATLAMRNTGAHHPAGYLLGWIIVLGLAAATATICLAIRATSDRDTAGLIRALDRAMQDRDAQPAVLPVRREA